MNNKFTVSILKNTNRIISSSDDKFIGIGKDSLIKLENESILHTVANKESFFYIQDFKVQSSKIIYIEEDSSINLQKGDILKISYKEYEAKFVINILNEGSAYEEGDEVNAKDGILSIDISTGGGHPTIFNISQSSISGNVKQIGIKDSGRYIIPPNNPVYTYSKRGDGLELEVKYLELSNRSILEREITDIYFSEGKTFIMLNYSLPPNLSCGKLSVEKHALILSEFYTGNTSKNINYQIFRDFTPNLKLPLLVKNSLSPEAIFNRALFILDKEIKLIKDKLNLK